jgi:cathepsin A (carboxypeptidase C)
LVLAIPLGVPSQKPLISGDQLDWKNADCFPSSSENGNNTICIQQVYDPVIDSDILPLPPANQFCGYMAIGPGPVPPVQLFFWVVLSEHDPAKDPVVLWMNGGPGSTSLYGLFDQWGPRVINHTKRPSVVFKDNPNRLTEKLTWVFLEQPSGTGFSTGGAPVTKSGPAAGDMSKFITALFEPITKFKFQGTELSLAGLDFHIAGESFAGHYIPALGGYMVKNNQHTKVNLRSFLLGNSMIDPSLKGVAMEKLVCGASPPLTLIGSSPATTAARCRSMHSWKTICDPAIRTCLATPTQVNCDAAYNACYESWGEGWSKKFMRNVYDATKDKANQVATKSFYDNEFANFMNDPARRARLGVAAGPQWHPSSATMVGDFLASGDWMTSYIPQLQDILNSKTIDVLLYAVSNQFRIEEDHPKERLTTGTGRSRSHLYLHTSEGAGSEDEVERV